MNKKIPHTNQKLNTNIPNKNGFKVPSSYFKNLEDDLTATILTQQLPKNTGFKTPKGYFETFKVPTKKRKLIQLKKLIPYAAAAAILIAIGINKFTSKDDLNFDTLNTEDIESWIVNTDANSIDFTETDTAIDSYLLSTTDVTDSDIEHFITFESLDEAIFTENY